VCVKQHMYKRGEVKAGGLVVWWFGGPAVGSARREVRGRFLVCDSKLLERSAV
jgi:hypothetical protein